MKGTPDSSKAVQKSIADPEAEEEETAGRKDLGRYSRSAQKELLGTESALSPMRTMPSRLPSGASPGKSVRSDPYYQELQDFIEDTLKLLAERIAEKKSIEMESSVDRIAINKLNDEVKSLETKGKALKSQYDQESEGCEKLEQENAELEELLRALKGKSAVKNGEIDGKLKSLQTCYDQFYLQSQEGRKELTELRGEMDKQRNGLKAEIREIYSSHVDINQKLDGLDKQMAFAKTAEQERLKMLVSKSKLLDTLVEHEDVQCASTVLHKDISRILKSPSRARLAAKPKSRSLSRMSCGTGRGSSAKKPPQ